MTSYRRTVLFFALTLLSGLVCAQNSLDNPDWVEEKEPPAPAFSVSKALPLEMPNFVSVKVGIDPGTIYVGADGIVRYVAVMTNTSGSSSAVYEGIRCLTGEVKTYARSGSSGVWSTVTAPAWRDLLDNMGSQHARMFARQAACSTRVAANKSDIIKALQSGIKPGNQKQESTM
jgi:hypothetical protein